MSLQVYICKGANNSHENFQFRRIAKKLINYFEEQHLNGKLIYNPIIKNYPRFRPDALLLCNKGLILIDLKDYIGEIDFVDNYGMSDCPWVLCDENKNIITVKGGSYKNPYRQLGTYRNTIIDVIKDLSIVASKKEIDRIKHYITTLNIFTSIKVLNFPREIRGYFITDEKGILEFLYDLRELKDNAFAEHVNAKIENLIDYTPWISNFNESNENQTDINKNGIIKEIDDFYKENFDILIIKSADERERDQIVNQIFDLKDDFGFYECHIFAHSNSVIQNIYNRNTIKFPAIENIYNSTYDFKNENKENSNRKYENEINIKQAEYSENSLIIIHEAHLITSSVYNDEKLGAKKLESVKCLV